LTLNLRIARLVKQTIQPQRTLVAGYTHVFSSSVVNQFNPGASWYSSIFEPNHYAEVLETFPIVLVSGSHSVPFTTIGGNDNTYPQVRKVTQWQINDNLTWTHEKHTWKFGITDPALNSETIFSQIRRMEYGAS